MSNTVKIWVGNLPYDWTETDLLNFICEKAKVNKSDVLSLNIALDEKKISRGFGVLTIYANIKDEVMNLKGVATGKLKLRVNDFKESQHA